ncbi:hypothetical protein LTR10_009109 [Elasticomyces elasticus]|nr:hypothetical protein LTR10_009109 [Elasticomyces elasticus]KAK4964670.1 hypothetical protein LTR42_012613 [Elasticomyces elasticus]
MITNDSMVEPPQGQIVSTHGQGSTQSCRLLALPKELRLLIYEAYFGPTRKYHVAWAEHICWWVNDNATGKRTAIGTKLLLASRQICEEAVAVMLDRTKFTVDFAFWRVTGSTYPLTDANAVQFLQHVRVVDIEMDVDATDCVFHLDVDDLRDVLKAMNYGANVKQLTFYFTSRTTLHTKEFIVPNDEVLKAAISSLRCADGAVKVGRFALGMPE